MHYFHHCGNKAAVPICIHFSYPIPRSLKLILYRDFLAQLIAWIGSLVLCIRLRSDPAAYPMTCCPFT